MIDLTQILITEETVIQRLFSDTRLCWVGEKEYLNYDKESIRTSIKKEYKGVVFDFHHGKLEILFKPHYYFNNNLHNANDFSVKDCINTFKEFLQCFGIQLKDAKINNLEFGLNIVSPIPVKDLITYIKYYHRNAFINQTGLRYSKISSSINTKGKLNSYKMFKAYAKSVQFPQYAVKDLVRLEVKSCESKFINSLGIYTVNDVMNSFVYRELSNTLYKEFSEVLIMDYGLMPNLNAKDSKRLRKYLNPDIWYRYLQGSKNTFNDNKKKYLALVRINPENLFDKLLLLIKNKFIELNNYELESHSKVEKKCAYSTISIYGNGTNSINRKCVITGLDLSMQKANSKMLSHTGLKYYHTHNKEIFTKVKQKYLTSKWESSNYEVQVMEIAHNIRNKHNNLKIKQERSTLMNQFTLFDLAV